MEIDEKVKGFMDRVKKMEKSDKLDLSSDEDLSIAVMNLISIEEHLFFSGGKTGKTKYFELLEEVRTIRKKLLKMLIKDYEGEVWCISKHLLATSMRVMEVGTKALSKGEEDRAYDLFKKSYDLYNMFLGLNLGLIKPGEMKDGKFEKDEKSAFVEISPEKIEEGFFTKLGKALSSLVDCCKE